MSLRWENIGTTDGLGDIVMVRMMHHTDINWCTLCFSIGRRLSPMKGEMFNMQPAIYGLIIHLAVKNDYRIGVMTEIIAPVMYSGLYNRKEKER